MKPLSEDRVEKQLHVEISEGNYIPIASAPLVVSSIGAIPKDNGKVRLIHDLSRPDGGMNQFVTDSSCSFKTLDLATSFMSPGCYVSKIDLQSAYRSIPIHPDNYPYMGLSWDFTPDHTSYFFDAKLPFGSKKACKIFQCLSDSVCRMLERRNVKIVNYLDDFLIISPNKTSSWLDLDMSINLLTQLGFDVNWNKVEPPCQSLVFLGINVNTVNITLSLPPCKLPKFFDLITSWQLKKRCSKKSLLQLLGKLNWACRVIRGGRTFLRRLIDKSMTLRENQHRCWLNSETRRDLNWWLGALKYLHGSCPFVGDLRDPECCFFTDSCLNAGGGVMGHDWFFVNYKADCPWVRDKHINTLEMFTILCAVKRWGHLWRNSHVRVRCDNFACVQAVNKGTSRSKDLMYCVRKLFWLSLQFGFRLTAVHVPGEKNFVADMISRLNDPVMAKSFLKFCSPVHNRINCYNNMSFKSFLSLPLQDTGAK